MDVVWNGEVWQIFWSGKVYNITVLEDKKTNTFILGMHNIYWTNKYQDDMR